MRAWLRHHRQSCADALRRLVRAPLASLANAIVLGVVVALPLVGWTGLANLRAVSARVVGDARIAVFLALDAKPAEVEALQAKLRGEPLVASVRFIGRDEALAGLRAIPSMSDAIGTLKANPLPDAFDLTLKARDPLGADALATRLRAEPKVAHVQHDAEWLRRLDRLLAAGRAILAVAALLLGIALAATVFQMVRTQLATRTDEIRLARLVGATDATIRRPFAYLGLVSGLAGGLAAWGIAVLAVRSIQPAVSALAIEYGASFALAGVSWPVGAGVAAAAGMLGLIGAGLAVSMYLHKLPA